MLTGRRNDASCLSGRALSYFFEIDLNRKLPEEEVKKKYENSRIPGLGFSLFRLICAYIDASEAIKADPNYWQAYLQKERALVDLGFVNRARKVLRQLLDRQPQNPLAIKALKGLDTKVRFLKPKVGLIPTNCRVTTQNATLRSSTTPTPKRRTSRKRRKRKASASGRRSGKSSAPSSTPRSLPKQDGMRKRLRNGHAPSTASQLLPAGVVSAANPTSNWAGKQAVYVYFSKLPSYRTSPVIVRLPFPSTSMDNSRIRAYK